MCEKDFPEEAPFMREFPGKTDFWSRLIKLLHERTNAVENFVTVSTEIPHRDNNFVHSLHEHEKLCCLTKRFWDTTEGIVKHAQKPIKNLGELSHCEAFRRRL